MTVVMGRCSHLAMAKATKAKEELEVTYKLKRK